MESSDDVLMWGQPVGPGLDERGKVRLEEECEVELMDIFGVPGASRRAVWGSGCSPIAPEAPIITPTSVVGPPVAYGIEDFAMNGVIFIRFICSFVCVF